MAANKIIAPQRGEVLINRNTTPTLRTAKYFEEVSRVIESFTMSNVTTITQTDATTAGATYNQVQVQSIVDLANANKAKINELLTKLQTFNLME